MASNNCEISEELPAKLPQPQIFRLSQSAGLTPQRTIWGNTHHAPSTLGNCHAGIARALTGERSNEFSWWSDMLDRHLKELVTGYMEGCRSAQAWNLKEIAQVHWYAFSVKMRLRGAKHFPALWRGADHSLAALNVIHSS